MVGFDLYALWPYWQVIVNKIQFDEMAQNIRFITSEAGPWLSG